VSMTNRTLDPYRKV